MGVMRFRVCQAGFLEGWPEAEQAYISGFDGRVFPTRVQGEGSAEEIARCSTLYKKAKGTGH